MSFFGYKQEIFSEKGKLFHEGQKVSFIYKKEKRTGKIEVLKVNSAVIRIENLHGNANKKERTVISYDGLMLD